jgi:hypothetical protein
MLLSAAIVILLGLFVVRAGILTAEKMQLQNAADATAYSVSTIEARDLNFTAYTNRAMVANEIAIGQVVGLMSWAAHFASVGPFMDFYFNPLLTSLEGGTLGIAAFFTVPMRALISALTIVGNTIRGAVRAITTPIVPVISAINRAYSIAQRSFHLISFLFSIQTIDEMIRQNADGAKLSGFGLVALAGHFLTYYSDLPPFGNSFVTSYRQDRSGINNMPPHIGNNPGSPEQKAGMERLASVVNASRDPFSRNRYDPVSPFSNGEDGGWSFPIFPPYPLGPIDFTASLNIDPLGLFGGCPDSPLCVFSLSIYFQIAMDRNGGTDLRYVERGQYQLYNWSAADTTAMNADIRLDLWLFGAHLFDLALRGGPPLGIGAAQAGKATGPRRATLGSPAPVPIPNMMPVEGFGGVPLPGEVELDAYGGSPGMSPLAWLWASPIPAGPPSMQVTQNNIGRNYPGLPRYNDTKAGADPIDLTTGTLGFEAPYLMIGLIKESEDIEQKSSGALRAHARPRGRFQLADDSAADQLGVIAKSEVYFARPNNVGYFRRADGQLEYGSGFNPYWQARLVDTTYLDRVAALAIQQRQLWLPSFSLGPFLDSLDNILDLLP